MSPQPLLVFSPHLDDAALSAWSVVSGPGPVDVVNVFDGIPSTGFVTDYDRLVGASDSASLAQQRVQEDREALARAGRVPRGLGFLDDQYRDEPPDSEALADAIGAELAVCSGLLVPAGIGGHPDHLIVRDLCLELAGFELPITIYAEVPYAIRKGWPHWVTGAEPDPYLDLDSEWERDLETLAVPRQALVAEAISLTEDEAAAKLAALRTYRTQFPSLNSGAIDRLVNPAVHSYEVFWRLDLSRV